MNIYSRLTYQEIYDRSVVELKKYNIKKIIIIVEPVQILLLMLRKITS